MIIVGLDLSLTGTGIATIDTDRETANVETRTSKPVGDNIKDRAWRLRRFASNLQDVCYDADLVVIEAPSLGQKRQAGQHDRMGLWWLTIDRLTYGLDGRVEVAEVTPASLKKFATGKGNASKDEVLLSVARRFPGVDVRSNDEADALVLAAMGARHLGHPIDSMPQAHLAAMDAVRWPDAGEGVES